MSSTSPKLLPAGPYVIRNKGVPAVLHAKHANLDNNYVWASGQDETLYRDQQIWWVEPLANHSPVGQKADQGVVYSITNPGTGKSLQVNPETGYVKVRDPHGAPWQRWRLQHVVDNDTGDDYYLIINVFTEKVLDLPRVTPSVGDWVEEKALSCGGKYQSWRFVVPTVPLRSGWFHIENAGTSNLLSHDYATNPPILLPKPESLLESQYKEGHGFQWALVHSKVYDSSTSGKSNSWVIINRLTRTRLTPHWLKMTPKDYADRHKAVAWELEPITPELILPGKWRITNCLTRCLLQEMAAPSGAGKALKCDEKKFNESLEQQSWILRSPLLYKGNMPPPGYKPTDK